MTRVLYITSSSFSGSTLLSFLLNAHPDITTIGEADGWNYGRNEVFPCSCGVPLSECSFFQTIAAAFGSEGLPFDPRGFGTRYRLLHNIRLNRYLTAELPGMRSTTLEWVRDQIVSQIPSFARLLARQDRANSVFIRTALAASDARVFVDACKSPYRLRHLRRIRDLDLRVLHVVRDPRGVVLSNMKKKGYAPSLAMRLWINEQATICRIANEFPQRMTIHYEDLCEGVDDVLAAIHRFIDVPPRRPPADFRSVQHHILGNEMRLGTTSTIVKDARWKDELSVADLRAIARVSTAFRQRHAHHPLSEIIVRYGCDVAEPSQAALRSPSLAHTSVNRAPDRAVINDPSGGA